MSSSIKNESVTIFGGTGFVGNYIVKELAKEGAVINLVSRNPDDFLYLKTLGYVGQINLLYVNIFDEARLDSIIRKSDHIINLIGIIKGNKKQFFDLHIRFPELLSKLVAKNKVKTFTHISAILDQNIKSSLYAETKRKGEEVIKNNFAPATIIRPSVIFGSGDHFFCYFAKMASRFKIIPMIAKQNPLLQPIYAKDLAKAIIVIIKSYDKQGHTYELGGKAVYSFDRLMKFIKSRLNNRKILLLKLPYFLSYIASICMAKIPNSPMSPEQVILSKYNNVVDKNTKYNLNYLGIKAKSVDEIMTKYLRIYS